MLCYIENASSIRKKHRLKSGKLILRFRFGRLIRNPRLSLRVVLFLPLLRPPPYRAEYYFTPSLLALALEVLLEEAIYVTICIVLNFVE